MGERPFRSPRTQAHWINLVSAEWKETAPHQNPTWIKSVVRQNSQRSFVMGINCRSTRIPSEQVNFHNTLSKRYSKSHRLVYSSITSQLTLLSRRLLPHELEWDHRSKKIKLIQITHGCYIAGNIQTKLTYGGVKAMTLFLRGKPYTSRLKH